MAAALIALGALFAIAAAALYDPRAGLFVLGVSMVLAGVDLARPTR